MKKCHRVVITYEVSIYGSETSLEDHLNAMNELRTLAKTEKGKWSSAWRDACGLNGIEFHFRSKVSADRFIQMVQNKWSAATVSYQS